MAALFSSFLLAYVKSVRVLEWAMSSRQEESRFP